MLSQVHVCPGPAPAWPVDVDRENMPQLRAKGTVLSARPLRSAAGAVRAFWTPPRRRVVCAAAWLAAWYACGFAFVQSRDADAAAIAQEATALRIFAWLLFSALSVEFVLAFVEREPSTAWLRRALRVAPLVAAVVAFVAAAFAGSLRFAALGYVAGAIAVATIVAAAVYEAPRQRAPFAVFAVGWLAHAGALFAVAAPLAMPLRVAPSTASVGAIVFLSCAAAVIVQWMRLVRADELRRQRNVLDSARKYRHVYYSAPVALLSADLAGQIQRWNDLASKLFPDELRQGRVNTLATLLGAERASLLIRQAVGGGRHRSEVRLGAPGEKERIVDVDALLASDALEISFVDVTERTMLARTLEHMAYHDPLTNRLNLHGLEREIQRVSARVASGADAALFYVDLHRFKAVNDVFGHAAGNALVVEVARRIESRVPEQARIARLGGDEFLVVLPDCPLQRASEIAQAALAGVVDEPYEVDGKRIRVDASTGVVEFAVDMSPAELIAYANAACREARTNRGSGVVAAQSSGEHLARYRAEVALGLQMRTTVPTERIAVFAQPIVPLRRPGREAASMSYEVLLRERAENGKFLPPTRLIAAAERHGAMRAIDRHMLEQTLAHLHANPDFTPTLDFVTVNLSGTSLNDERFLADAYALLRDSGAVARRVCLEITESIAMFDIRSTRRFVEKMRALDVRIALDDFGAGYSSFAYLRELPASLVKIDGQFMPRIDEQPRNQVIVSGIRRLTEELGMACVAEWVEDVPALEFLLRVQMDYVQGFVLARPQPIAHWLSERVELGPLDAARARLAGPGGATVLALREPARAGVASHAAETVASNALRMVST
ncbi:MAG: EAL domain-containing protein [Burkholderiaceae bacterium]|nr:EAL domain-containing protein [Burkholderiaceae bacterium]